MYTSGEAAWRIREEARRGNHIRTRAARKTLSKRRKATCKATAISNALRYPFIVRTNDQDDESRSKNGTRSRAENPLCAPRFFPT